MKVQTALKIYGQDGSYAGVIPSFLHMSYGYNYDTLEGKLQATISERYVQLIQEGRYAETQIVLPGEKPKRDIDTIWLLDQPTFHFKNGVVTIDVKASAVSVMLKFLLYVFSEDAPEGIKGPLPIDDMMKEIIADCLLTPAQDLYIFNSRFPSPIFLLEPNTSQGSIEDEFNAFNNSLYNLLSELKKRATAKGDKVSFDLVPVSFSPPQVEFRTYHRWRGHDLRQNSPTAIRKAPLLYTNSPAIQSLSVSPAWGIFPNVIYGLGNGTGEDREITDPPVTNLSQRDAGPFTYFAKTVNAPNSATGTDVYGAADSELARVGAKAKALATLCDTNDFTFGRDYGLGDLLTIAVPRSVNAPFGSLDMEVIAITVNVTNQGRKIQAKLESYDS
jgi:hypothetical protein